MAGIFNRAYDQADRMLNTSGLSSIVYRQGGGRSDDPDLEDASFFKKAKQYILDSKLPYDTKMELYNLVAGSGTKDHGTGQQNPNMKLQRGASNFLKDMVVNITAPVGTPVGKGASMIPGLQTTTDLTRRGIQSLLQNKTIREKLAEFADSHRKPGSKKPIPPNVQLFIDQFSPDKVIDGKRYYTPITDENKSKYFDEESQGRIGKDLKTNLKSELGLYNQGFRRSGKLGAADIKGHEEGWALGRVNYGSYDSRGNWQPGIPDWDGNFTIKDEYDWNRTHRMGPGGIAKTFMDLFDDGGALPLQFAEAVGGTVGAQEGEGRKIEFKVPGFSDPVKQLEVMNRLDRPFINKGLVQLPDPNFGPLARTKREDKIYSKGVGLPGIGWHHEAFDDPDDFTEQYTDYHTGLKHGGQTMSRGLSGINKSININGQPHSLAWINPGEASALRAMGGSGKKVDGIPAYFDEFTFAESADVFSDAVQPDGSIPDADTSDYDDYKSPAYQQLISPEAQADLGSATTYQDGVTWRDPYPDKDKGPAGGVPYYGGSDPLTTEDIEDGRYSRNLIPFYNALKETGMTNAEVAAYLSGMGPAALSSMRESYDTGYSFGGPMGTMRGLGREQGTDYAKKLKLKEFAKELKDLKDKNLSQKDFDKQKGILFSKYQDMAKDLGATITEGKRFKSMYSDIPATAAKQKDSVGADIISGAYDWNLLPGQAFAAGLAGVGNALTGLFGVVGGFTTPDGKSFSLMDDGTLVEPDIYADTDEGNIERQPISRLPPPVVQPATLEPELTGIAALQAERPEVASVAQSLQPQFDNLASIFGREKAAEFLNQPVNIFA